MSEHVHHPDCKCFVIESGNTKLEIGCHQRIKIPGTISTIIGMQSHGQIHTVRTDVIGKKLPPK